MAVQTTRRRRTYGTRKSHTINLEESVWQAVLQLCLDGHYANPSDATEKALIRLLDSHTSQSVDVAAHQSEAVPA